MSNVSTKVTESEVAEFPSEEATLTAKDTSYWLEVNPAIKNHDAKYHHEKRIEFLIKRELLTRFCF